MRIGIVGGGVVGTATARSFIEHVDEVRVYDSVKEKRTHTLDEVLDTNIIFVCLPTPRGATSLSPNLEIIRGFFSSQFGSDKFFVLKSTVPIGTTAGLREEFALRNLVHSPEFLTARCSIVDAQIPSRNIVGMPGWAGPEESRLSFCASWLASLLRNRFPSTPVHIMSSDESEAVKLFQNGFFAVKVAFWNEMYQLAKFHKLDWEKVINAVLADGRIHPSHTGVPGPDGKTGFGGACLPKDLANLVSLLFSSGLTGKGVCGAALERNEVIDRKE